MADEQPFADLTDFEKGLAGLAPDVDGIDRDHLLFFAGRHSELCARRNRWLWPTATVCSTITAFVLAFMLGMQRNADNGFAETANDRDQLSSEQLPVRSVEFTGVASNNLQLALDTPSAPAFFRLRQLARVSDVDTLTDTPDRRTTQTDQPPYPVIKGRYFDVNDL